MLTKNQIKELSNNTSKPVLWEKGTTSLWTDDYISKMMLDAHLNPDLDAATRPLDTVKKTVEWISSIASVSTHPKVIDLGCGPGIYTSMFYDKGYEVTGVDFSKESIDYAVKDAEKHQRNIEYIQADYTSLDDQRKYDIITLIYCDYGVMSDEERHNVLDFVSRSLSDNGIFIFDVFTPRRHKERNDSRTYSVHPDGGFFSPHAHVLFEDVIHYPNAITLDQYTVIDEKKMSVYRVWDKQFEVEELKEELQKHNLNVVDVRSNLMGEDYNEETKMLGLIVKK